MIHKNTFKLCLGILLSFMMLLPTLAQNTKSFKGVVVDETGEPIIGAAVKVVDTTIGTITDLNGKFVIMFLLANWWKYHISDIFRKESQILS